jgi:cyclase
MTFLAIGPVAGHVYATSPDLSFKSSSPQDISPFANIEELTKGVFFARGKTSFFKNGNYEEAACNNGWIIFDDFVVVIDANFPSTAAALLREIRKTTNKPVRYIFNTHHHGDHLYGNSFWVKNGATCIAYSGLVSELHRVETGYYGNTPGRWEQIASKRKDLANYPLLPPQISFTDKIVIEDKSKRLELLHLGAGHTRGDGVAWLTGEKILFTGDSCLNGPYNLFRDANVTSWITTLDKMHYLQPKVLVPGHGPLGDTPTIKNQQEYFKTLCDWVNKKKNGGISAEALKAKVPELRSIIERNEKIKTYLIPEPEVVPGFSLAAQILKIYETNSSNHSI